MKKFSGICLLLMMWIIGGCSEPAAITYDIAAEGAGQAAAASVSVLSSTTSGETHTAQEAQEPEMICVYICGAVTHPDVYELPEGSRVRDAVLAAGGMTDEADGRALNLAELLSDGRQIIVYTRSETERGLLSGAGEGSGVAPGRVNLNSATKEQLMTLPGIGEVKADAILQYRIEHGGFTAIESIREISGIGEKSFEKLKELITV